MSTFTQILSQHPWEAVQEHIYAANSRDVERALSRRRRTWNDFLALVSPAAAPYLETMAHRSHRITRRRFGNVIQMYLPMYLSNECHNICTYCGFRVDNKIPRLTLSPEQIIREVEVIKAMGYNHILLVTGEANNTVGTDYLESAIRLVRPYFAHISLEVQPLAQPDYERLKAAGLHTVLVYQETYHQANYKKYHPKGRKSNFQYRLETPDRIGQAGIHKIGLGVLLGLEDWRVDSAFTALHLDYLERKYWQSKFSISFPRLRPAEGAHEPTLPINERALVQLICAWRLFNEDVELSLSTRESPHFRDHVIPLGITATSAGSRTEPGGYALKQDALEQFDTCDNRSSAEVADRIREQGYEPVWKDWSLLYQ